MDGRRFGAIEAGGTKFLCAIGSSPDRLGTPKRIPTTSPTETLAEVTAYFEEQIRRDGPLDAIGIASFGPAGVRTGAPGWGRILSTPKPGWSDIDLAGPLKDAFGIPVGFDTDVNGAALAEYRWGAAKGCDVATYITVGTGIGGGTVVGGRAVHGSRHPEVAHFFPRRHEADLAFAGVCPFHDDCVEGLASGSAIARRWGTSLSELPQDHIAHDIVAYYLGQLVTVLQAVLSPQRIVIGGGVSGTPGLLPRISRVAEALGNSYFGDAAQILTTPGLGERAGLLGAVILAEQAYEKTTNALQSR